ncbi:hypothetical protein BT93_E1683 [Corymbia citriodora subsp. variegata]|nr:hypothetical protein BT93_E1683 [Corymbia citriodora subsp. variegata]
MPRNVSSSRTIFPASRCSSDYTSFLMFKSRPVGSTSNLKKGLSGMMKKAEDEHDAERSPFDWSKSSILLKYMARDSLQAIVKEPEVSLRRSSNASPVINDRDFKRKSLSDSASASFSELRSANVAAHEEGHDSARERVIATLSLYRDICHELGQEKSRGRRKESIFIRRVDYHAAKEVKRRAGYVHGTRQFIGHVPGVEVGDKFRYRMELAIVGLHRPLQSGIDCMGRHPDILATSVVASWDYADDLTNPEELVYLGQGGGIPSRNKKAEDQKLTHGNLALANSMKRNKPVRVIRKDWNGTFTYDGLYKVDQFRKVSRFNGKMVFEFTMKRLPGQPEILQKMKEHELSG